MNETTDGLTQRKPIIVGQQPKQKIEGGKDESSNASTSPLLQQQQNEEFVKQFERFKNEATKQRASEAEPVLSSVINSKENEPTEKRSASLFTYIADELKRDYMLEYNEKKLRERRKRVYTFVKTPKELEKRRKHYFSNFYLWLPTGQNAKVQFLLFGFLLCFDVFLFIFTFLPIRLVIAVLTVLRRLCSSTHQSLLDPVQKIDVLKGVILITCCFIMQYIDTSVIYHVVRVQSVIKLYVVYNMMDIADKLLASFGQDVLDALYWTATEPRSRKREHVGVIPHLLLSLAYVALHMLLNLAQAIVLNVAINSFNKALLTIMISNQFIEIKTSVFKKFEKNNLFQISCSDARERFYYLVLLLVVGLRNLTEYDWDLGYAYSTFLPFAAVVIGSEFLVDWFKHAFITKFNNIQPEVYTTYRTFLAKNILRSKHDTVFTGHTDQVSRRMGFTALPLAVLLVKIVGQCVTLSGWTGLILAFLGYLCLCVFKLIISVRIFGNAIKYVKDDEEREKNEKKSSSSSSTTTKYTPSWSFEPQQSIQEIRGSVNSDSSLFASKSSLAESAF